MSKKGRTAAFAGALIACLGSSVGGVLGCGVRDLPEAAITFEDDVGPLLSRACGECHGTSVAEASYRVDRYLEAIGCVDPEGRPAVVPSGEEAPVVDVLRRGDHAGLLTVEEQALLTGWVREGAPAHKGRAHPRGYANPRSPEFHGYALRAARWAPMLDPSERGACARCHAGVGGSPGTVPEATDCTACHDQPGGPLACSTCHGTPETAHPPRDPCFHPDEAATAGAHRAHVAAGITCDVCHGPRDTELSSGPHGDGTVDVSFDRNRVGAEARFDASTRRCTDTCHARDGARPSPSWDDTGPLECNDCHQTPPADHYAGDCNLCHAEASPNGTGLTPGPLHANGRVDLGDGSGGCDACHGASGNPAPLDAGHTVHTQSSLTAPMACDACHITPGAVMDLGHLDATEGAEVTLGDLASARGAAPRYEAGSCADVACHGVGLGGSPDVPFRWSSATPLGVLGCGSCHGAPPPAPHAPGNTCAATACHGAEIAHLPDGPSITDSGRAIHIDGHIDAGGGL